MMQALVTIVAHIGAEKLKSLPKVISEELGNPATTSIETSLGQLDERDGESSTHFASLHAIPAGSGTDGYLILEFSADGSEEQALARIDRHIGRPLTNIFMQASDWNESSGWRDASKWSEGEDLLRYLRSHVIQIGHGLFSSPGVAFAGTPRMTVGRIRKERDLAAEITKILGTQMGGLRAIDRLTAVRAAIAPLKEFAWALDPPPPADPDNTSSILSVVPQLVCDFAKTYLWPLGLVLLVWVIYAAVTTCLAIPPETRDFWTVGGTTLSVLWRGVKAAFILSVALAIVLFIGLRRAEARDWVDERWPDRTTLDEIVKRENFGAQNHMASITRRKPGLVRWFTIRLIFWIISELVTRVYRPGFLSDIGTIHFARWITVPKTRDFIFLSNYGGSWESYLEDFITRAHFGLTGIWSNSIGFPRSNNLVEVGASDGERFKRYARRSMLPTPFWYSAYRDTTTSHIRTNASIRRGLASGLSNEEALDWLALFGSAARPDSKLENSEIQSLVFGGLGFLPFGVCLLNHLSDDRHQAQCFIKKLTSHVAFNDGRRLQSDAVITLGLGPKALGKLGLPQDCVKGFPAAFLSGMAARARILGDVEENAVDRWLWGSKEPLDIAILIYGNSPAAVERLDLRIQDIEMAHGSVRCHRIELKEVEETGKKTEPFGFADGISQPVIRGTYKGLRKPDPIHIVEPGEFLLGYPDNRGNIPPGPTLSPLLDPHNRLPIAADDHDFATNIVNAPREIGRNGTFLVIRQLAQKVSAFDDYCRDEAKKLQNRLGPPYRIDRDFIAAKLVGRWKDGSSLVRNPYKPRSEVVTGEDLLKAVSRMKTNPDDKPPIEAAVRPSARADNDFLFGEEDPEALRCPYGAHIRRANPRDSFDPGSKDQIDISNRHRLLRVGRFYNPEPGQESGLLFMCLNGDLERQFEFIQQSWLNSPSFHGLVGEQDPIVGGDKICTGFLIPSRDGPVRLSPLHRFVTTLGGGYFFLPSKRLLQFLGGDE